MAMRVRLLILAFSILVFSDTISAEQVRTYQSTASAPILENDIAYAKQYAFQRAQHAIMDSAIQDLLDPEIYKVYFSQIIRNQSLRPRHHLISVKILKEASGEGEFNIEIEAKVQIATLEEELRKMDLVFKSDPWFPVTLLIESGIDVEIDLLKKSLAPFHVELRNIQTVDVTGIPREERHSKTYIEDLFLNYSNKGIIYILETTGKRANEAPDFTTDMVGETSMSEASQSQPLITGIQFRIVRQSDLEELNTISLALPRPLAPDSEDLQNNLSALTPGLFSRLTVSSVKRNVYNSGLAATYEIEVSGLNSPYLRSAFEHHVLREHRSISSFALVELSTDSCRYLLHSGMALGTLAEELLKPNPYFELTVERTEFNTIGLSAFYQYAATGIMPMFWQSDKRTVREIRDTFVDPVSETKEEEQEVEAELNTYYIPTFREVEPNNSIIQFNRIPSSTYILGEVSSRADEDIFELKGIEITEEQLERALFPDSGGGKTVEREPEDITSGKAEFREESPHNSDQLTGGSPAAPSTPLPMNIGKNATVYIDWIQFGKTSLAPQLKLYDENFNFINSFSLVRSQKRLKFHYTFPNVPPDRIYVRISDRIGFIQGETGGFKQYRYMIRYSWNNEDEKEPENPLIQKETQLLGRFNPSE